MRKFLKIAWKWLKRIVLAFFALSILSVIVFRFVPVPFTPLMLFRCIDQKMTGESMKLDKKWVSFDNISPNLPFAVFCSEDQDFFKHHGFNFKAIQDAMKHDEHSKRLVGASTISQQTAKNVFLSVRRSWIRKGFEAYFTVLIELFWSKKRIMEVYLNVIEFGKGIYGAEAASEFYFHKHAKDLNKEEAAALAAILPDPLKWSPIHSGPFVESRRQWIIEQMNDYGGKLDFSNPPK
ncbi:MAG TPA: monofunctional biosynthetic peptidoglycan transglycosylase [Bacteroidia bacterium]|jgi:monofunctional biosynthetic peptidoglycan transglycosylase|nr:monofunctional biosynthetic peptidoglycan transglycosylase [Bacteroidia bacterium]